MRRKRRSPGLDVLMGAAAGAAGTWLMDLLTTAMYEGEPPAAKKKETEARGDRTAYEIVADKAAALAGRDLADKERKAAGAAIHWSLGVSTGAAYGLLRNRTKLGLGSGLAYGMSVFLLLDEAALTAFGITRPPQDFPWQTHARGLAGHLLLGAVLELPFDLIDLMER